MSAFPAWRALPLLAAAFTTLPAAAATLENIRAAQEIVLAHRDASVPFSYLDQNRQPVGYAVDICLKLVEAVKRELALPNLAVKYLPVTSGNRIAAVAEGKAALECGSTTNNAERRKQVAFTIPHFISAVRLLVRSDSGFKSLDDMSGRTVTATTGTTTLPTLRRIDAEHDLRLKIVEAPDHAQAFGFLETGKADAFALDDVLLYGLRANSAKPQSWEVVGKAMSIEPYAIMLPPRDPAFKKVVDQEMRRLIASGEIQTLYRRWFQQPIPPKGINLELPMPAMLRDSFRYPSDKTGDLE
ncbi:transporter substrate-binding domain-containing protein [Xylophilus rhododendri]|uniref:Transporter substrate-binding domain-containing protein n=1 Tax=Xylophilus rhododendri TaxID=2697032 RepID=A0A857J6S6_9BURK|nr:amino acid ABC transporter substrate-binding protein [Xylophilus rhododendri]QHI98943.1 transporter substrate-binding domain-containing protein [Xylophilus rhododendri]